MNEDLKEKAFAYLDKLRESGTINMHFAAPCLEKGYSLTQEEADELLWEWMETFSERSSK